jgi:transglutaminase superfamily protein
MKPVSRPRRGAAFSAAWVLAAVAMPGGAFAGSPGSPAASAAPAAPPTAPSRQMIVSRWTAATPDDMVEHVLARARRGGEDALAGLVVASSLDERASFGKVRAGLSLIAASSSPFADDARWLGYRLQPEARGPVWPGARAVAYDVSPDARGLVKSWAILGPFQDNGAGLMRREGPEAPGESWSNTQSHFAWGVYDVAWRRTLPASSTARGVPLDLYVHPRAESCTYLATRVAVPAAHQPFLVHVAAGGAVRLIWDGADVAASEDSHPRLVLDRLSARVDPVSAGDHLLAVKVCSGPVADDGRVRVRFTDEKRAPLALATSSNLAGLKITPPLPGVATAPWPAPPVAVPVVVAKPEKAKSLVLKPTATKPVAAAAGDDADPYGDAPAKAAPVAKAATPVPATRPKIVLTPKLAAKVTAAPAAPAKSKVVVAKAAPKPKAAKGKLNAKEAADAEPTAVAIIPPQGVTVLRTSLDAALDLGESPSNERVLAASILRTIGGAEDSRSPRAPGLLDRIAGDPEVAADTLAMAGWVSPFGSNRSGWLNLARTKATASRDQGAAAFAQRRLIATHLGGHTVNWALGTMQEAPFRTADDAEARLMRAMSKRKLGATGFGRAGEEDLNAIESQLKDRTPISVLTELFDATRGEAAAHVRVAQRLAEVRAESRDEGYVEAFRSVDVAAFEKAAAETLAEQTSADDVLRIGNDLLAAGRYPWAREAYYAATLLAPNRAAGFQGLAAARESLAAVEARTGATPSESPALALASLARARDLEPGDAMLKAEIAFRSDEGPSDSTGHSKAMRDEQYLVAPAVFLDRARKNPAKKGSIVDRQLHWLRVVTYHPDKRVSQLMHYSREIVIEPRSENELFENVPAEGDECELLIARVHRKDGTVVQPEEMSSGGRKPFVRWPDLKTGDVVEIAARSWTAGPVGRRGDAPFYFIDYVGSTDTHPILYNEVIVDSAESSPLAIDVLNGKADRVISEPKDGRKVTRYVWDNPPSIPDEPLAPKLSESLPVVVGSTFGSWGDFREWYRSAVKGFTEPDDQVRRLAEKLTAGKKTRDEKLKALFEFVADDIRYVNFVSGEWWLPNRPQELLARRQGDCDDKAMLLITLLKASGIDATEVLVQTRYTAEPSLLRSEKAAIPVFDHGIAYLPGKKGEPGIWLDATSPESRLGPLPSMDARTVALFIDEGAAKIIDTPASSPDDHGVDATWTIKLSPTGAGDLVATERHTGDAAFELRMNLKQADARSQWVEQYLASGWFPTVQVQGDVAFKPDLPRGVATLGYGAHTEGLARREGEELAVPVAETSTLTSQLAPLVKRTLPVVLPPRLAPGHETRAITIVAPPGFAFADLPPGGDEPGGEFGKAHLEFARASGKNAVIVKRSVVFDMSTIPVEKYAKWRDWLQRVDGLMHRMVRLVPDGKAPKAEVKTVAEAPKGGSSIIKIVGPGKGGGGGKGGANHP